MKSLKDYIQESYEQINEAQIYEGGEELAKYICKIIKDNPKENFFIINSKDLKYKNIFFKHLLIYVNENINEELKSAEYHQIKNPDNIKDILGDILKWNIEDNIFNYIEISIETTSSKDRDIDWEYITHELNHAWDDYQEKLKDPNKDLWNLIKDINKYDISRELTKPGHDILDQIIGFIEYVSTDIESKSFSVQAMSKLKNNLDKYSNFEDAINWQYENNKVFKQYINIKTYFDEKIKEEYFIKLLCDRYRKRFNEKKLSNDEIIKSLKNNLNKYYKMLTEDINKILDDYAKKNAS